ncbi:MAG: hypothetical protein KGZ25_05590, partial [Planctomycetes bacterium]|nr:hypothetical protein [Planctomycetota bacterium]
DIVDWLQTAYWTLDLRAWNENTHKGMGVGFSWGRSRPLKLDSRASAVLEADERWTIPGGQESPNRPGRVLNSSLRLKSSPLMNKHNRLLH